MFKKTYLLFAVFLFTAGLVSAAQPRCVNGNITLSTDFVSRPLPENIIDLMRGKSYPEGTLVPLKDLRYITMKHVGFDGKTHDGEMVVHKDAACDAAAIFQELYLAQYPIEKIRLIDHYNANDHKSMADNNSSSFCWRLTTDGSKVSYHALGMAIDINPLQNPYIKGDVVDPVEGKEFLQRTPHRKGMIADGDAAVKAFKKRGWTWGADWAEYQDWQHFEKFSPLREKYTRKLGMKHSQPEHKTRAK